VPEERADDQGRRHQQERPGQALEQKIGDGLAEKNGVAEVAIPLARCAC
jgi:hypothetical protein